MGCILKGGGGLYSRVAVGAVLLAAGSGSRMGHRPKSLLELGGVPLIRRQLIALSGAGMDEVVVVLFMAGFEQRTIPRQMWAGIREQISPTILAVATLLIIISTMLLASIELLRRRNERMRGVTY